MTGSVIEVRVVGVATDNNVSYSNYQYYELRDPNRLYAELIEPTGRSAVLKISEINATNGAITKVEVVDAGVGYDERSWNYSILSFNGSGADFNATLDGNGSISDLNITSGGTGYALGDVILSKAPTVYEVGQPLALRARVNDPSNELSRVAFYANGAEIPGTPTEFGNERILTFTPTKEEIEFVSTRALYGNSRDLAPATGTSFALGQGSWGWIRNWESQHCYPTEYQCPSWYWDELAEYWSWPPPWLASSAQRPGALPVQNASNPRSRQRCSRQVQRTQALIILSSVCRLILQFLQLQSLEQWKMSVCF